MVTEYIMRAYKSAAPVGYVYWASVGAPDFSGAQSGYTPSTLSDIVVDYTNQMPVGGLNGYSGVFIPNNVAAGDLANTYPDPTVFRIQGFPVSPTAPSVGQALEWNGSVWGPTNVSGGGSTGAIGPASGDLSGTFPDPTVAKIQGNAVSPTAPIQSDTLQWNGSRWDLSLQSFNVKSFGAKGDGITDDTTAIQNTINAATTSASGATVFIPAGTYLVSSTIVISSNDGLIVQGVGGQSTLIWNDLSGYTSDQAMLQLNGCHRNTIKNLYFQANFELAIGILVVSRVSESWVSSQNRLESLYFLSSLIEQCIRIGDPTSNGIGNNDMHNIINCRFESYAKDAIEVFDTQSYCILVEGCVAIGEWHVATGAAGATGTLLTTPAGNIFAAKDVGKYIEIDGAGFASSILNTSIATMISSTQFGLTTAATVNVPTATIQYGSQSAMRATSGQVTWLGGFVGQSLFTDFYVGGSNTGAVVIHNVDSESSRRLLFTGGPAGSIQKLVRVQDTRYSADSAIPGAFPIDFSLAGNLVLDHCQIGDPDTGEAFQLAVGVVADAQYNQFVCRDCTFGTSVSPSALFANGIWPVIEGTCRVVNTDSILLGQVATTEAAASGTLALNWGLSNVLAYPINGNTVFTIPYIPLGIGSTVRLVLTPTNTWMYTWPGNVNWGPSGAPITAGAGQSDIYEFSYDGTTIWGHIISGVSSTGAIGPASGDLSGSYPGPTVAKIQGHAVSPTAPAISDLLQWNGSQWDLTLQSFNVKSFGAKMDNATNDITAFTNTITAAAAVGGIVFIPNGTMLIQGQVTVPSHVRISGVFAENSQDGFAAIGSQIVFSGVGAGFLIPDGSTDQQIENLLIFTGSTAGPAFHFSAGNGMGQLNYRNISIVHGNPTVEAFLAGNSATGAIGPTGCGMEVSRFDHFSISMPDLTAKQAIAMYGANGAMSNITFSNLDLHGPGIGTGISPTGTTAEFVHIENIDGSLCCNMTFEHVILEQPLNGGIHFLSVSRSSIKDVWAGDLGETTPVAPLLKFVKSSYGSGMALACGLNELSGLQADMGVSGAPTILLDGATDGGLFVVGSQVPFVNNGVGNAFEGSQIYNMASNIAAWNGSNRPYSFSSGLLNATAFSTPSVQVFCSDSAVNSDLTNGVIGIPGFFFCSSTGNFSIDGVLTNSIDGQEMTLFNGSLFTMTIVDQSNSVSSGANRIYCGSVNGVNGNNTTVAARSAAVIKWSAIANAWFLVSPTSEIANPYIEGTTTFSPITVTPVTQANTLSQIFVAQTTNPTGIAVASVVAPDSCAFDFDCEVTGILVGSSTPDCAKFKLSMTYASSATGTLTPVGSVTTSDSRATTGAAAWTATIVPTGSAVTVSVTGGTGAVNWNTIAQWRVTQ